MKEEFSPTMIQFRFLLYFQSQPDHQPDQQQILEIRWLRDRIKMLETDNASMNLKLSKNQKDIAQRLTEIEMQIGPEDAFVDDEDDEGGMADEETSVFADEHLIGQGVVRSLTASGSSSGNGDVGVNISVNSGTIASMVMSNKRNSGESYEEDDEKNRESFI